MNTAVELNTSMLYLIIYCAEFAFHASSVIVCYDDVGYMVSQVDLEFHEKVTWILLPM